MRIFRCDVCKRDVELAQLKGGTLTIKLGDSLLLNLPDTDRCDKCHDNVVSALKTVISAIDDTQHGKIPVTCERCERLPAMLRPCAVCRGYPIQEDTNPDLDLTPLLDDPTWVEGAP